MRSPTASSASGSSPRATGGSGEKSGMRREAGGGRVRLLVALAVLCVPTSSWALFDDRVELWAAENVTHDSNVLRLSKDLPNAGELADTIYTTHAGATFNAYEGQQHFTAEATYFRSNFRHFNDFDFNGYTAMANWAWVLGPTASGTIGYQDQRGLASFNNIQAAEPDL